MGSFGLRTGAIGAWSRSEGPKGRKAIAKAEGLEYEREKGSGLKGRDGVLSGAIQSVMPQSLSNVLVHLIFSTKDRQPLLAGEIRDELYGYIGGVMRNHSCRLLRAGGVSDHVHLLIDLSRTATIAQVVERAKTSTSKWLKSKGKPSAPNRGKPVTERSRSRPGTQMQ